MCTWRNADLVVRENYWETYTPVDKWLINRALILLSVPRGLETMLGLG